MKASQSILLHQRHTNLLAIVSIGLNLNNLQIMKERVCIQWVQHQYELHSTNHEVSAQYPPSVCVHEDRSLYYQTAG